MNSNLVTCHKSDAVWTLTLNRPDKANALSIDMLQTLSDYFTAAGEDPALRALIGSGRTSALLLGGQKVDAERALCWGLLDYVVEREQLEPFGASLIQTACRSRGEHLAAMKQFCRGAQA